MKKLFSYYIIFFVLAGFNNILFAQNKVVINEVMVNPLPDSLDLQFQSVLNCTNTNFGSEYIEIFNNSKCDTFYLDCYIVSIRTSASNTGGFAFPAGTQIAPLDFIVVGGPNVANADFVLNNFCGSDSICGNNISLENNVGYVGLYKNDGTVEDAVYWTNLAAQPNELITNAAFDNVPCIPARCLINGALKKANQMIPGLEISYAGGKPLAGEVLHRTTDGIGGWQRSVTSTPNNCNGTCQPLSDLTAVLDTIAFERCKLENGYLSAHGEGGIEPYEYDWNNGDGDSLIANLSEALYTITVTDFEGCKDTFTINLPNVGTPVSLNINPTEATIFQGDSVLLSLETISSLVSIDWKPSVYLSCGNCATPFAFPIESKEYIVFVADIDSCLARDTINIKVLPDEKSVFIPNIFTPNGDDKNEGIFVRSIRIKTMQFRIYDRWGKEVFFTENQTIPWTGLDKNGNKLSNGVYAYILDATFNNGKERVFKGNITLVK